MIKIPEGAKIYACLEPVDMRKSINGLSILVVEAFSGQLTSGDIYVFFNKKRDISKALYWDKNGFVLHHKRLEQHKYVLPKGMLESPLTLSDVQLEGLLAGLDFMLMKQFSDIKYDTVF